jgi:LuxR family maltose regulon positive regulatory protein
VAQSGLGQDANLPQSAMVLVGTKVHAPPVRKGMVKRERLLEQLGAHAGPVLVAAPPGSGKTTLLSRWSQVDDRAFAWLTLEVDENDPFVFWRYVLEAIRTVEPFFGRALDGLLATPGTDILRIVVPRLLNELESLGTEITLVLDDYHVITNAECQASVQLFLQREPQNVRLVISTRTDPSLPLARLRASGELLQVRASDLALTLEESERLLNGELELGLSPAALSILHERTEGWPAGLYLAYLSLRDAPDREAFVSDFGGSMRLVVDYLTEVVLDTLDDSSRSFLLDTSILERMSGDLCDFVTGRYASAARLADLERANLFLVPLGDGHEWYRYHHLFGDLLRDELRRRSREREAALHARASEWLAGFGDLRHAIRHAIAAGELEAAVTLVSERYLQAMEWDGSVTVGGWIDEFPPQVVAADARLSIVHAWLMTLQNRRDDAELALEHALASGYQGAMPDGAGSVDASAALLRAGVPWGDVGAMLVAARRGFELEGHRDSPWRVTTHVQLGWALFLNGESEEARPLLEHAARIAPRSAQWMNACGALCLLAWVEMDAGRIERAEHLALQGRDIAVSHGLSETPVAGWLQATHGAILAERGRCDEAAELLDEAIPSMRTAAQPVLLIQALLTSARVRAALGSRAEARTLLDEARVLVGEFDDPGVLADQVERVAGDLAPVRREIDFGGAMTDREVEVLRLLEKGLAKREVAATLYVSYNTIHSHTRSIYRKLGTSTRPDAIERARELGIL